MNTEPMLRDFESFSITEFNKTHALMVANYPISEQEHIHIASFDDIRNMNNRYHKKLVIGMMEQIIIDYVLKLNHEKADQLISELKIQHISYDLITKMSQIKLGLYMKYLH